MTGTDCVPSDGCRSSTTEYPLGEMSTKKRESGDDREGRKGRGRVKRKDGRRSVDEARHMPGARLTLYYKRYEKRK